MDLKKRVSHGVENVLLLWRTWNLHGFVLFSLCLQVFLFFAAPFRKKTTYWVLAVSVWSAYQLVGTAIDRSLALVKSSNNEESERAEFADLYTLWAAFLVLHFGGPDTITALAMEDNNLWRRIYAHVFILVIAVYNAASSLQQQYRLRPYIFLSTGLIFISGIVKSGERVLSLTRASFDRFRESLLPQKPNLVIDYAALMDLHDSYKASGIPVEFVQMEYAASGGDHNIKFSEDGGSEEALSDEEVVTQAHHFFQKFKGMYVDMVYCCHDRSESRRLFLSLSFQDAFRIVETQMKFSFDLFYTKMPLLSQTRVQFLRWLCFFLQLLALLFWSMEYKHHFKSADLEVTRALLFGTIFVDIIAFVRFYCSDWMIASSAKAIHQVPRPFRLILQARKLIPFSREFPSVLSRQWSDSISQFNFINYSIDERCECSNTLFTWVGAKDKLDGRRYVLDVRLSNALRQFIFQEVKYKAVMAEKLNIWEQVSSSRGSWVLRCNASSDLSPTDFEPWIMDVEYDESLLIWHIATELFYATEEEPDDNDEKQHRIFSKNLSDYMLYLMDKQPKIMSSIAPSAEVIFKDTCSEAREFFHEEIGPSLKYAHHKEKKKKVHLKACQAILEVPTGIAPGNIKGESKSVLFDACRLATYLIGLKRSKVGVWKLTSQIWVDLLCFAAAQTSGSAHVIQLCEGGELLTLLRLLMLQLGLSPQFRNATRIPRSELVVLDRVVN